MSAPRFPWEEAMTLGLGTLRLPPHRFWRMTLPELAAAARALQADAGRTMARGEFNILMTRYPDSTAT